MTESEKLVRTTLPSSVKLDAGAGGLPRLSVRSRLASAELYFQGAHLTSWQPSASRAPVLWMSRKSLFEPGRPIRGGVPVCFPWFGPHPTDATAPAHGFARAREWTLVDAREDADGTVTLAMELAGEDMSPLWPWRFSLTHRINVGRVLQMDLEVRNLAAHPFTFEEALHTYFSVEDVRDVTVTGLEGTDYVDKLAGLARRGQGAGPVRFTGETDRIYLNTRATCVVHDPRRRRRISIQKIGSDSTVVWNPWIDKARAMPDFGDDEWPEMVCIETCNVNVHARRLAPGDGHTMTARVEVSELDV